LREVDNEGLYLQCIYMETTVQKWGNSLALRLPKAIAMQAAIQEGSSVDLVATEEGILVKARRRPKYRLAELVSRVSVKNLHAETGWGKGRGREVVE
jgi:antitoxin MazE